MVNLKAIGSKVERELVKLFWNNGWACVRAAGSGSTSFPSPDLMVANGLRKVSLEVKFVSSDKKYFSKDEIVSLKFFADRFGTEAWVVIKFKGKGFYFVTLDDLIKKDKSFLITLDKCNYCGFSFEEFINI